MDESSKLRVSELDFSQIKDNFKKYLQSQDYFKDFDYEGSTINALLDVLAYNTHYNSYYLNMVANEMFIDSAVLRSSLISLSKMIGYKPRSRIGATANVNVIFSTDDSPDVLTIPRKTKFFSTLNGVNYTFVTENSYTTVNETGLNVITIPNVSIKEGEPLSYTFTANTSDDSQRFILPNLGIDSQTIEVQVQESITDTRRSQYTLASDLFQIGSTSNVFFVEETTDFYHEIRFGDNVLGRKPKTGNIIIVNYNICSGVLSNDANSFFSIGTVAGYDTVTITTNDRARGGSDEETLESIRFNGPKNYSTQNRAVTTEDYRSIIQRDYPGAESVVVFGGEDAVPPVFGKVFVGIRPKSGLILSSSVKERIKNNILKKYNVASITPEFIDIDYLNIALSTSVKYNSSLTNRSIQTLRSLVLNSILNYSSTQIENFNKIFRISSLQRYIDNTDSSILGNDTKIKLKKQLTPTIGSSLDYFVNFNNTLYYPYAGFIGTISSSVFSILDEFDTLRDNCRIENNENVLVIYNIVDGQKIIRIADAGSIDFLTGRLELINFNPISITGSTLDIFAMPDNNDLETRNEQILIINSNDVTIEMKDISTTITTNAQ